MMIQGCLFILITFLFLTLWHSKDLKLSFCICLCNLCLYLHICSLLAQCSGWAWTKHSAIKKILQNYLLNQILNQTEENLVFGTKYLTQKTHSFSWYWNILKSNLKSSNVRADAGLDIRPLLSFIFFPLCQLDVSIHLPDCRCTLASCYIQEGLYQFSPHIWIYMGTRRLSWKYPQWTCSTPWVDICPTGMRLSEYKALKSQGLGGLK